ncbi:MAG TPA: nitroreductase/quinone reductase family protein [Candidatus Limnocylindria bacterium]|nr:nitroreductase/quinone reductase family protein [Candidatus Limnocylindria bacterium]
MPAVRIGTSLRLFWRTHRTFMRLTGGRFGRVGPMPALLLTTRGRKTGEKRDVALSYLRDDGSFVVVASYVGEDRDPAWWRNLQAHPDAELIVDGKRFKVRAHESDGATREQLWRRIVERDPAYDEYQQRTKRRLAVVVLDPI